MVKEIDDPGWNLEMYRRGFRADPAATYWDAGWAFWFDDELTIDNGWLSKSTSNQDEDLFHEISHGQGTSDSYANDYNCADMIANLMHVDKENWLTFKNDKKNADKKCNQKAK